MPQRGTGWLRDPDLARYIDLMTPGSMVKPPVGATPTLVTTDNASRWAPPFRDQQQSEFCARFSTCAAIEHAEFRAGLPPVEKSPLFLAWLSSPPGEQGRNTGTWVHLAMDAATRYGVPSADQYPWSIASPGGSYLERLKHAPDEGSYRIAARHQILKRQRITDGDWPSMVSLFQRGIGFTINVPLRQSALAVMESGHGGPVDNSSGSIVGYHSMYAYDAVVIGGKQYARVRNQWGPDTDFLYWPVGRFGTDEATDGQCVLSVEEVRP